MHRIRLRAPWKATWNVGSSGLVYTRNFHMPTGAEGQAIALEITLLPKDQGGGGTILSVLVNGRLLLAEVQSVERETDRVLHFQLKELAKFNFLELRISLVNGITGANRPEFETASTPTFGSFVIESVELQID